ncbi:Na+/H+ antiporter NhaA [Rhodovarius crocodyli]|uniref:Na(+)/H(+) antiporter NhaA n=1 Tax=Rhodovarius crocodyli TaxID=1979269 RepID=A0A437LZ98_9PROT|nr:Na+/H+ antiporter NhaA [Rhodovarius crocodyli]RVT90643.1 Na+/H+ antiporter NhaA [Rhodovarius crocodyli]
MNTSSRALSVFRQLLDSSAGGGLVLMAAGALAIVIANSPLSQGYHDLLHAKLGPLSVEYWINDGLMVLFFLLVGLEIKREMLDGQLANWGRRILPGVGALGGMLVPGLIYAGLNHADPVAMRGWAIPTATDIAFALAVLSLAGPRVPASLKVFLMALAVIDDLGAIVIIALFYTESLSLPDLLGAAVVLGALIALNRAGVLRLWPYMLLGVALWVLVFRSGIHATIAGVLLALCIPLRMRPGAKEDAENSPLHRLEHRLHVPVSFFIMPIFGLANAGVALGGMGWDSLIHPVTAGVTLGLLAGKVVGVFGAVVVLVKTGLVPMPRYASWPQVLGVALLCGIGFTMSLFVGGLAFSSSPERLDEVKLGILVGSGLAGLLGWAVLRFAQPRGQMPDHARQ